MTRCQTLLILVGALLLQHAAAQWPQPKCVGQCNKLWFWKSHNFKLNWAHSDNFYQYAGRPNPAKWTVHDPHRGIGTWDGRQPGLCHAGNVWIMKKREFNHGGLRIQAMGHYKWTASYRKIFHVTGPRRKTTFDKRGYNTYTTGMISSKRPVKYGYFEVEAKTMKTQLVNAFWFSSRINGKWTEIDVFENSHITSKESKWNMDMRLRSVPNAHVYNRPTARIHRKHLLSLRPPHFEHHEPLAFRAHVYGLLWTPKVITWFFDGKPFVSVPNKHWHQPMFVRFDVETNLAWHGILPNRKLLHDHPRLFSVHYFRVYSLKKKNTQAWTPAGRQLSALDDELLGTSGRVEAQQEVAGKDEAAAARKAANSVNDVTAQSYPGLKEANTEDPTTLQRAPYAGETFGEVVPPPPGMTWAEAIAKYSKHTGEAPPKKKEGTSAWRRFLLRIWEWFRRTFYGSAEEKTSR